MSEAVDSQGGCGVNDQMAVVLYSDGACRGNPGLGAWAYVLHVDGDEVEAAGVVERTTNNRMELEAAIQGLSRIPRSVRVRVVTDSQYLCKGMSEWVENWKRNGWKTASRKPVLNRDQWERLVELAEQHEIRWEWVRGHDGHEYNERCDARANEAMDEFLRRGRSSL